MRARAWVAAFCIFGVGCGIGCDLTQAHVHTVTKTVTKVIRTPSPTVTLSITKTDTVTVVKQLPDSCVQLIKDLSDSTADLIAGSSAADELYSVVSTIKVAETIDSNAQYVKLVESVNHLANIVGSDAINLMKRNPLIADEAARCKEETK